MQAEDPEKPTQKPTLREWRERERLSQAEVSEMIGVSAATLSRIEAGGEPSRRVRQLIDRALGRGVIRYPGSVRDSLAYLKRLEPDAPRKSLGWWRQTRSMSQIDLALASGISERTIGELERGARWDCKPKTRRALAKALMVHPDKLLLPIDGEAESLDGAPSQQTILRAEVRGKTRVLRRAYDFLRDGGNVTHRAQDDRGFVDLLVDIERELRGT